MDVMTSYKFEDLDFDVIVPETQNSYWGSGRSREGIIQSFENSFPVGLRLTTGEQIGWARATSDTVYHAYIYDLQVIPEYRGKGLGKKLTKDLIEHPMLRNVTGWMLATRNQHALYRKFGFEDAEPGRYMAMMKSGPCD